MRSSDEYEVFIRTDLRLAGFSASRDSRDRDRRLLDLNWRLIPLVWPVMLDWDWELKRKLYVWNVLYVDLHISIKLQIIFTWALRASLPGEESSWWRTDWSSGVMILIFSSILISKTVEIITDSGCSTESQVGAYGLVNVLRGVTQSWQSQRGFTCSKTRGEFGPVRGQVLPATRYTSVNYLSNTNSNWMHILCL